MTEDIESSPYLEKMYISDKREILLTVLFVMVGSVLYFGLSLLPVPHIMVSFFALGLVPTFALLASIGAIRGPLAGFFAGVVGKLLVDFYASGEIVLLGLPAISYGVIGLIVGLTTYDFDNGRSLAKLSILSTVGLAFALLLTTVVGLFIGQLEALVAVGFLLLPSLSLGIPSIMLLTPLLVRLWHEISKRVSSP